ncbi:MAG: hypothetical protein FJX72_16485, partial [Armatimonadetes bacterium]|nr:hypothetical protein [Armatimonadota bacterium]
KMLASLGVPEGDRDTYHLKACPTAADMDAVKTGFADALTPRLAANVAAIRYIADKTELVPCGMCIGPFSLMVKLLDDPISAVYVAGTGVGADEDPDVRTLEATLDICTRVILGSITAQLAAGARMMVVAEPAANLVYISPKQLSRGSDVFERLVMQWNRKIAGFLVARGVELFFHCCGELTDDMVRSFGSLDPAILSLGSSRKLWEDAALVGKSTVLFGNLPTKRFYADELSVADVEEIAAETCSRMRETGHPHILGSECDVLSVPGRHEVIAGKVAAFMSCSV